MSLFPAAIAVYLGNDFFRLALRHLLVTRELHRVDSPSLRERAQRGRIAKHLAERYAGTDHLRFTALQHATDLAAPAGQVTHHFSHVFTGRDDFHIHDRLEQYG